MTRSQTRKSKLKKVKKLKRNRVRAKSDNKEEMKQDLVEKDNESQDETMKELNPSYVCFFFFQKVV